MELNKTESKLLLSIITGNGFISEGKLLEKAKQSLIDKGFLRINEYKISELNLSSNYFRERGYTKFERVYI